MSAATERRADVIWHQVECGGYAEDLPLWEELAARAGGPVLDLGCGSGRVALHLARRGASVHGVDSNRALVDDLQACAGAEGLAITTAVADIRDAVLQPGAYALAMAPMQLLQLLEGPGGRAGALKRIAGGLAPGGLAACAIVEGYEDAVGDAGPETVPDVREDGGWIYSSLPTAVVRTGDSLEVHRLRQLVSPGGELTDTEHVDQLDLLDAATLEREAVAAGLAPVERRSISQSELHVGSAVVVLAKEA
jgi:SAM-dependent methyltransferase